MDGMMYQGFGLIALILILAANWKMFEKAGKPGWAAIIPIYNLIILLEIIGKPIWWIILLIIPVVNVVIFIIMTHMLSKSFGKGGAYTLGLILIPIVFYPILGFGDAQYVGPAGKN